MTSRGTPRENGASSKAKGKSRAAQRDEEDDVSTQTTFSQSTQDDRVQSRAERTKLRGDYRKLIQTTTDNKQDYLQQQSEGLAEALNEGNKLYQNVKRPREAALDSEFLVVASEIALEKARRLQVGLRTHELGDFVGHVKMHLGSDGQSEDAAAFDFQQLGRSLSHYFSRTPSLNFMYGPLSMEPKVHKERKKTVREKAAPLVVPEEVKDATEGTEAETTKAVQDVKQHLDDALEQEDGGVDFFRFITNEESFGQTIENMFHCAFLIKDGYAKLSAQDGGPVLDNSVPPTEEDYQTRKAQRKQCVMRLDYSMWAKAAQKLKESGASGHLPHRALGTYIHPSLRDKRGAASGSASQADGDGDGDGEGEGEGEVDGESSRAKKGKKATTNSRKGKSKSSPSRQIKKRRRDEDDEDDQAESEEETVMDSQPSQGRRRKQPAEEEEEEEEETELVDKRRRKR